MVRHLDDTAQVSGYEKAGATVIKGQARLAGPGNVEAGGRLLEADHVVIATGSQPVRPPIEGLAPAAPSSALSGPPRGRW